MSGWATGYSFRCDVVDYSSSPQAMRVRTELITWHSDLKIQGIAVIFYFLFRWHGHAGCTTSQSSSRCWTRYVFLSMPLPHSSPSVICLAALKCGHSCRFSLSSGKRTARSHSYTSIITPSCLSPGGLVSNLLQV